MKRTNTVIPIHVPILNSWLENHRVHAFCHTFSVGCVHFISYPKLQITQPKSLYTKH